MDEWVKFTQAMANAAQAVAIVVGGAWVYFKFLRGRTFAHRAVLDIEASLSVVDRKSLVKAKVSVTNAGLSKVPLKKDFKWIEFFASSAAPSVQGANVSWRRVMRSDVFADHAWIEAQETITDEVIFPVPPHEKERWRAFRLELQVWGEPAIGRTKGTRWMENTIVLASAESEHPVQGGN
jgi:hypothetical protein